MKRLYQLAENENIKVVEEYLPGEIKGFYFRKNKTQLICLEKRLNHINKRIVFAEELGHHFTSYIDTLELSRTGCKITGKVEYIARKWAAEFLIPDEAFKDVIKKSKYLSLYYISEELNVTEELLKLRLELYKKI